MLENYNKFNPRKNILKNEGKIKCFNRCKSNYYNKAFIKGNNRIINKNQEETNKIYSQNSNVKQILRNVKNQYLNNFSNKYKKNNKNSLYNNKSSIFGTIS